MASGLPDPPISGIEYCRYVTEVSQQRGLSGISTRFPFHSCPVRRTGKPVSKGKYNNITFAFKRKVADKSVFLTSRQIFVF